MTVFRLGDAHLAPEWAWGVDVDTKAAHIAFVNVRTGQFETTEVRWQARTARAGDPGRRLVDCRAAVRRFADEACATYSPCTVAIERPTGAHPSPPLMMHAGVIAEALGAATGIAAWFIPIATWRKTIGLPGNCGKPAVLAWADALAPGRWSAPTVDQAEALGVATAAASTWQTATTAAA